MLWPDARVEDAHDDTLTGLRRATEVLPCDIRTDELGAGVRVELKQLIPYTIVAGNDGRVLCLKRTKAGGDARLHDKLSIGVGGHVNPVDAEHGRKPLEACGIRELAEELHLPEHGAPRPVGWINDDSNPVGAVHLGWVQVLVVDDPARIAIRETDVLVGELQTADALRESAAAGANFETWSSLLLADLEDLIGQHDRPLDAAAR